MTEREDIPWPHKVDGFVPNIMKHFTTAPAKTRYCGGAVLKNGMKLSCLKLILSLLLMHVCTHAASVCIFKKWSWRRTAQTV